MVENGVIIGLLALIATVDLAQFAVTLEHRGRLAAVEQSIPDRQARADGGAD